MRIVFMGTPNFAVPSLQMLIREEYDVVGVFCQPDRPKGRGRQLAVCPVKAEAVQAGIPVFQPEKIRGEEGITMLTGLRPDLCVTAAFGQILSREVLAVPPLGTINVHASLLPRHRGSAPVHQAIIMGDRETGVTTMMTNEGIDTGDILLHARTRIGDDDTAETLTQKLAVLGAEVLMETLAALRNGTLVRKPQDNSRASYEPKLTKETGKIDWTANGRAIDCLVRGTDPWPGAYTDFQGNPLKVCAVRPLGGGASSVCGQILEADSKKGLIVSCGDGLLEITELQMPGQKRMFAKAYLTGHRMDKGAILGGNADA